MATQSAIRRGLDRLAYASLILDVCIAVITTLSYFDLGNHQGLLVPINYLLTLVVVLTLILFALLLLTIAKERQVVRRLTGRLSLTGVTGPETIEPKYGTTVAPKA